MSLSPVPHPRPVRPGDRIGVAALSGPVLPERLDAGIAALRELGFEVVEASNVRRKHGLFAGSDDERLDGFYELVDDPSVRAVVFARGGWGVNRLLPRFDWDRIAAHPRAYVGYSDLTPFLHGVVERLGFAAFHGPMVAADFARGLRDEERASFLDALAGQPQTLSLRSCEPGPACEAPLLGGCLSLLVSLLQTPWQMDLEDALLFIEDLDEPPYRFDRMLTHLRLSGTLRSIAGLMIGHLHAEGGKEPTNADGTVTLDDVLEDLSAEFPWPLARGLSAGHAGPNWTLPLGARARLEPGLCRLIVGLQP